MTSANIKIDSLRDEFESNTEWNLRKRFLKDNMDNLDLDRLICLSRCFVNMAVYKCSYPPSVMEEVRGRSSVVAIIFTVYGLSALIMSGFDTSNKMGRKGKGVLSFGKPMGIQFVKSSETLPSSTPETSNSDSLIHKMSQNINTENTEGKGITQPIQLSFGSPAVNFHNNVSNSVKSESSSSYNQAFVKSGGEGYSSSKDGMTSGQNYGMSGFSSSNMGSSPNGSNQNVNLNRVPEAQPVCSVEEYLKAWKAEKDPMLQKLRKLAYEAITLKSTRPNAKDKLHSAANRVPLRIEFNTQPVLGARNSKYFSCDVFIENIRIASGQGAKVKDSKTNAYEAALQKVLMPYMRIIQRDPTSKELQVSKEPFNSEPPKPSEVPIRNPVEAVSQHKESNLESAGWKRRHNEYKPLDEFVVVEPKIPIQDCTAAHTLRMSADFNHMLLEYEYFFKGEAARCVCKIENEILADVSGVSKAAAKNIASAHALKYLKKFCWIIKTKQAFDSNSNNRISKDEIVNELFEESNTIANDNIGNKMLRKMGWSGGGVGKDGTGIAEPVSLERVLNREGLGLSENKGLHNDFRKRIKEVIESYACSDNQEDLLFGCDFRLEERQIIHEECRRLNLKSKSRGKGVNRGLCVSRKRSVNQLFNHLMSVGGETARYQLVPPGCDVPVTASQVAQSTSKSSQNPSNVCLERVLTREGLGLSESTGIDEFRKTIKEVIENYASSDNEETLLFTSEFSLQERQIIHDECGRLDVRSKSKGKGGNRFLCVKKKKSANNSMSVGGGAACNPLVQPGYDVSVNANRASQSTFNPSILTGTQGSSSSQSMLGNPGGWRSDYNNGAQNDNKIPPLMGSMMTAGNPTLGGGNFTPGIQPFWASNNSHWQDHQGPNMNQHQGPSMNQHQGPSVNHHQGPSVNHHQGPSMNQHQGPSMNQHQGPNTNHHQGPSMNQHQGPNTNQHQGPNTNQYGPLNSGVNSGYNNNNGGFFPALNQGGADYDYSGPGPSGNAFQQYQWGNAHQGQGFNFNNSGFHNNTGGAMGCDPSFHNHGGGYDFNSCVNNSGSGNAYGGAWDSFNPASSAPSQYNYSNTASSAEGSQIDSLRDEFESNTEWNLRKRFLKDNMGSLDLDRLICLSRCFVNMAVYKCSYPPSVMEEVRQRSNGVLDRIEQTGKCV